MPSFRAVFSLAVVVPALICGATLAAISPTVTEAHKHATLPCRGAANTTETQPNRLIACTDQQCTEGCVNAFVDSLPQNVCQSLSGGFSSFEIISGDLDGAPFVIRLGQDDCGALSFEPLQKLNICFPSGSTVFTEFVVEAGSTPFD